MHTGLSGSLTPEAPNLAGKVLTVNGRVAPEQLGISLMHEHLFCDLWKEVVIDTTTTTQADVENNTIRGKIFVQPTRAVEFVSLDFVVTNAGAEE